jgi:hypothetical protein
MNIYPCLILFLLAPCVLAGVAYRQGTSCNFGPVGSQYSVPGDLAVARLGQCVPWSYPSEFAYMRLDCASGGSVLNAFAFSDNQCSVPMGNGTVALSTADSSSCAVINVGVRSYYTYANCSAPASYTSILNGLAVGFDAVTGGLASNCEEMSRATPVVILASRNSCPATTNALVNMFVTSPASGKAAITLCGPGGTTLGSSTVPIVQNSCQVVTIAGVPVAYQFVNPAYQISSATRPAFSVVLMTLVSIVISMLW